MSRAFTREPDGDDKSLELPERPVSPHPNWVTPRGWRQIEERITALEQKRDSARAAQDGAALAEIERDLRYWRQRRASAQVIAEEAAPQQVHFGTCVTLQAEDGTRQQFKLVGEDEADPPAGLISWVAPVAQALLGHDIGDEIEWRGHHVKIMACGTDSPPPP